VTRTRIQFSDFWNGFDPRENIWTLVLDRLAIPYEVVDHAPDLLVASVFGSAWKGIAARKRMFYSGENWYRMDEKTVQPEGRSILDCFDMVYSFDYNDAGNHYRLPLYLLDNIQFGIDDYASFLRRKGKDELHREFRQRKFCTFVQGNQVCPFRNEYFARLGQIERVDAWGELFNNTGTVVDRPGKIEVSRGYKFAMAFENSEYAGYISEKLVDALKSDVLPIYWGGTRVHEEFNEQAFINVNALGVERSLDLIDALRSDFDLYWQYYQQPIVAVGQLPLQERIGRFFEQFSAFMASTIQPASS